MAYRGGVLILREEGVFMDPRNHPADNTAQPRAATWAALSARGRRTAVVGQHAVSSLRRISG